MKKRYNLKAFFKDHGLTSKIVAQKTGFNKNTITNWARHKTDSKIPQAFILKLLQEFPESNLLPYFPTHAEILNLSKN